VLRPRRLFARHVEERLGIRPTSHVLAGAVLSPGERERPSHRGAEAGHRVPFWARGLVRARGLLPSCGRRAPSCAARLRTGEPTRASAAGMVVVGVSAELGGLIERRGWIALGQYPGCELAALPVGNRRRDRGTRNVGRSATKSMPNASIRSREEPKSRRRPAGRGFDLRSFSVDDRL
jgi:hypothetical protein